MSNSIDVTIERYMTPSPYTIGSDQPLSAAHQIMHRHDIRHLPVLRAGRIVGVVSLRDLHLMETLPGVHADELSVGSNVVFPGTVAVITTPLATSAPWFA